MKYYNLWDTSSNRWTSGFRRHNGIKEYQDRDYPFILSLQEVLKWIAHDWYGSSYLTLSLEDANTKLRFESTVQIIEYIPSPERLEEISRNQHALKYL